MNEWPDSFTLEMARCHLTGPARNWLSNRRAYLENWVQFRAAFEKSFVRSFDRPAAWEMMTRRKQNANESLASYVYDKLRLCRPLDLVFRETINQVATRLKSRAMALHVSGRVYRDDDELMEDLVNFERISRDYDSHHPQSKFQPRANTAPRVSRETGAKSAATAGNVDRATVEASASDNMF